jgi:hypothetical protein
LPPSRGLRCPCCSAGRTGLTGPGRREAALAPSTCRRTPGRCSTGGLSRPTGIWPRQQMRLIGSHVTSEPWHYQGKAGVFYEKHRQFAFQQTRPLPDPCALRAAGAPEMGPDDSARSRPRPRQADDRVRLDRDRRLRLGGLRNPALPGVTGPLARALLYPWGTVTLMGSPHEMHAVALYKMGRFQEAAAEFAQTAAQREAVLGASHADTQRAQGWRDAALRGLDSSGQ